MCKDNPLACLLNCAARRNRIHKLRLWSESGKHLTSFNQSIIGYKRSPSSLLGSGTQTIIIHIIIHCSDLDVAS